MIRSNFETLNIDQQQELVNEYGIFIRTQLISDHLCDIYLYDTFYVVFFYLCDQAGPIKSKCFNTLDHLEIFINEEKS